MAEEKKLEQEYLPEEITEKDVKKSWLTYYFFAETGISNICFFYIIIC